MRYDDWRLPFSLSSLKLADNNLLFKLDEIPDFIIWDSLFDNALIAFDICCANDKYYMLKSEIGILPFGLLPYLADYS